MKKYIILIAVLLTCVHSAYAGPAIIVYGNGSGTSGSSGSSWDGGTGWPRTPPIDANTFIDLEFQDGLGAVTTVANSGTAGGVFSVQTNGGPIGEVFGEPIGNGYSLGMSAASGGACLVGYPDAGPGPIGPLGDLTISFIWDVNGGSANMIVDTEISGTFGAFKIQNGAAPTCTFYHAGTGHGCTGGSLFQPATFANQQQPLFYACVLDHVNGTVTLYQDGTVACVDASYPAGQLPDPFKGISIGCEYNSGLYSTARIGSVRFENVARSAAYILAETKIYRGL